MRISLQVRIFEQGILLPQGVKVASVLTPKAKPVNQSKILGILYGKAFFDLAIAARNGGC